MNTQFLIDAVVRQTTVLLAQLATAGGVRAPLARIANQVFLDLAQALEDNGVSRKVGADMFGMALRAYIRKIQRLRESASFQGRSLWEAVLAFVTDYPLCSRHEVLARFARDDEALVRAVLHDLCDSGLLFSNGNGADVVFRAATEEELRYLRRARPGAGGDDLLWAVIYREGPFTKQALEARAGASARELELSLERLVSTARVRCDESGAYSATDFLVAIDAEAGWEAAVFDHYQALVKTICARLQPDPALAVPSSAIGGSTYTLDVDADHPLYAEVIETLQRFRAAQSELRRRVEEQNVTRPLPRPFLQVVTYAGQCVLQHDDGESNE